MHSIARARGKKSAVPRSIFTLLLALLLIWGSSPGPAQAAGEVTVTHIHADISGNPIAATDENGNLVWKETYQAFGVRTQYNPASAAQTQWFHGKEQDASTGLQYFGARHYDPEIGRFLGIDPVGFQDGKLHSFNQYAYGNNNPLRYLDPDGNDAITAFGGLLTESYNLATGNGFNGSMVLGALLDGYNGEGSGIAWTAANDVLSFVAVGQTVKIVRAARTAGAAIGAEVAVASAQRIALDAVNMKARVSASGMGLKEAGKFFGWKGNGEITKNISNFSKEMLESNGWTKEIIKDVAKAYREVSQATPQNLSALPRAAQMESLLKLWN